VFSAWKVEKKRIALLLKENNNIIKSLTHRCFIPGSKQLR
jgi:hypothetical protein